MKKILTICMFLLALCNITAQNYVLTSPEGFGALATGGGTPTATNTVTVTTYNTLKTALNSTAASNAVILVSGTIDCDYTSVLLTNKTIIGLPGARLRNTKITITGTQPIPSDITTSKDNSGILYIKPGSNNVIIRNLIFEGPGAFDCDGRDNLTSEGTNIWVDHCEFQDGIDGNFDIKGAADNTTVSWCKFTYFKAPTPRNEATFTNDHRFTNLVGSGTTDFPSDGRFSVTFKNCYWAEGCKARMPRARNAELHVLNCYFKTSVSGASAVGLGAGNKGTICYVENCNFEQISTISSPVTEGSGTTSVKFDGCTKGSTPTAVTGLDVGTAVKPTYVYTVLPVANVASYVSNSGCGAGATLSVTSAGVISGCPNLGLKDNTLKLGKIFPTTVDSTLTIALTETNLGKANIKINAMDGKTVFATEKATDDMGTISLNLTSLSKGVYLCEVHFGDYSNTWKFIKK